MHQAQSDTNGKVVLVGLRCGSSKQSYTFLAVFLQRENLTRILDRRQAMRCMVLERKLLREKERYIRTLSRGKLKQLHN